MLKYLLEIIFNLRVVGDSVLGFSSESHFISTKKYLILFLIIFFFSASYSADISYKFRFSTSYDSNILNLSDGDVDQFLAGTHPEKYKLKSVDDFISSFRMYLQYKNYLVAGHTQIDKIVIGYDKYLNNGFNDFKFVGFQLDQYLSSDLKFYFKYYYYPSSYINQYQSEIDPEEKYREFSYSKDKYILGTRYEISKKVWMEYNFLYSKSFYNKYFTYYNSNLYGNTISCKIFPYENLNLKGKYSYEHSVADREGYSENIPDYSYDSDIYFFSVYYPVEIQSKTVRFYYRFKFEDRYYQSSLNIEQDLFHSGRIDRIFENKFLIIYPLRDKLRLRGFYKSDIRKTKSPKQIVEQEKNYSAYEFGLGISYRIWR